MEEKQRRHFHELEQRSFGGLSRDRKLEKKEEGRNRASGQNGDGCVVESKEEQWTLVELSREDEHRRKNRVGQVRMRLEKKEKKETELLFWLSPGSCPGNHPGLRSSWTNPSLSWSGELPRKSSRTQKSWTNPSLSWSGELPRKSPRTQTQADLHFSDSSVSELFGPPRSKTSITSISELKTH